MGCASSKTLGQVQHSPSLPETAPLEDDKPKPLVFAIIRNGHEVIRGGLRDVEAFLQRNELELATAEWNDFRKWFHMHRKMELGMEDQGSSQIGFLRLMDKYCDNISTKEKFYDHYVAVKEREEELNAAFETNDLFQIKGFFYDFKDVISELVKREDETLVPLVQQQLVHKRLDLRKLVKHKILSNISSSFGFEFFVRYAFKIMDTHNGGMPRVRVYGYALYAMATRKQWEQWQEWIQETVSEASFAELEEVIKEEESS